MKQVIALLLSLSIASSSLAQSEALLCNRIFRSTDELNEINQKALEFVQLQLGLEEQKNWLASWLLQRSLSKIQLDEHAHQYDYTLSVLSAYRDLQFTKKLLNKKNREKIPSQQQEVEWIERALFEQGLRPFIEDYREIVTTEKANQLTFRLKRLFSHRVFKLFRLLTELPDMKDKEIPSELLAKIMLEGAEAHQQALFNLYKESGQLQVDRYRQFRLAYRVVMIVVGAYILSSQMDKVREITEKTKKDEYFNELDRLENDLDTLDRALESKGYYNKFPPELH